MLPSLPCLNHIIRQQLLKLGHVTASQQLLQQRSLSSFFSKEKYEERKAALKEELNRGYFDDFKDFRDNAGRVFPATTQMMPAEAATPFPAASALGPNSRGLIFPEALQQGPGHAAVVATSCRAGAQAIVNTWMRPLAAKYGFDTHLQLLHVIFVDSIIFRVPPLKWVLTSSIQEGTVPQQLYHFDNSVEFRQTLQMTNLLTGYVYVVDGQGLIRWKASGPPQADDMENLQQAVEHLLQSNE